MSVVGQPLKRERERERERWVLGKELLGRFMERERVCVFVWGGRNSFFLEEIV